MSLKPVLSPDADEWDAFVAWKHGGDLLQSWAWGELKARSGWRPIRLALRDSEGLAAAVSILARPLPLPGRCIYYAPRGPVLRAWDDDTLQQLLGLVRERAREDRAILLKIDPPMVDPGSADLLLRHGFGRAGGADGFGGTQPRCVMAMDISRPLDEIQAGFKPKWRYNIRLAERKGVTIKTDCSPQDLATFYHLLQETAERDGFRVRGRSYYQDLWEVLVERGLAQMFLAFAEDEAIAGALCFYFGPTCWYTYGASSNRQREKMPNHLMQWTMIRTAKARGCTIYDFRGVSPRHMPAEEDKLAGLNRFKEGFGAEFIEYIGEFDLPLSPLLYPLWVKGMPMAKRFLKRRRSAGAVRATDDMG